MAYDRNDPRNAPRDERSRWSGDRNEDRDRHSARGDREDRGFFERAGDEIASWFGDDDRHHDRDRHRHAPPPPHERERGYDRERERGFRQRDEGDWNERGRSYSSDRDRGGYRPITGDYGRSDRESGQFIGGSGGDRSEPGRGREERQSPWDRDDYRRTSRAGTSDWSDRSRHEDPHYHSWRQRQMSDLDRDYDDYRRENQARFESDFTSWRETRQKKRGLLGQVREHMEVVGNDDQHVGTVDKVAGDRVILTKSDAESGGAHHSLSCSEIDRVEGDRLILGCSAGQARKSWRDENRSRALFEREDSGEMGPRMLDRSFEGTYRR